MARYDFDARILRMRLTNWWKITNTVRELRPELFYPHVTQPPLLPRRRVPQVTFAQLSQLKQKWGAR